MSLKDTIRNLSEFPKLPSKTFTVGLPGAGDSWVKRKFLDGVRAEEARARHDDFSWQMVDCPDELGGAE